MKAPWWPRRASRLCIVLGASAAAADDLSAARAFAPRAPILAVNDALFIAPKRRLIAFATLHPEMANRWFPPAAHSAWALATKALKTFAPSGHYGWDFAWRPDEIVTEKWLLGSSGLYGVQVALFSLGFDRVILAGVPIQAEASHLAQRLAGVPTHANAGWSGGWGGGCVGLCRSTWEQALPCLSGRVRSVSGWTRDMLGAPLPEWSASKLLPRDRIPAPLPKDKFA